jgi:hypothetical protein
MAPMITMSVPLAWQSVWISRRSSNCEAVLRLLHVHDYIMSITNGQYK